METIGRREFLVRGVLAAAAMQATPAGAGTPTSIDETLRSGVAKRKIPAVVGMVADRSRILYAGASGVRDSSGVPVRPDSIFQIASMTKAITTVAALQLVEQGRIGLDEPLAPRFPQFENIEVLERFDPNGSPILRPAKRAPTLRHLLTHTSGLCYDIWNPDMLRYTSGTRHDESKPGPLMFEPGTKWAYGEGLDWAGRIVEALSGMNLEEYFQRRVFEPLDMQDTSYILPASKFERLVAVHHRDEAGELRQDARKMPAPARQFSGGGGLYSTAGDYVRFMQMILRGGAGPNGVRILRTQTVESMKANQIGGLTAGKMKSLRPELSSDVDMQPGHAEKWGLGFLINTDPYAGGRAAGSLAWAGLFNTYFWIDPKRDLCAVLLMQYLPFVDKEAVGLLADFEHAVYASFAP